MDKSKIELEKTIYVRQPLLQQSSMLPFMVAVGMAIQFKQWCDNHAWEEDYREQRTHPTGELFNIWNRLHGNYC